MLSEDIDNEGGVEEVVVEPEVVIAHPGFSMPKVIGRNLMIAAGFAMSAVSGVALSERPVAAAEANEVTPSDRLLQLAEYDGDMMFDYYRSLPEQKRDPVAFERAVRKMAEKFPAVVLESRNVQMYLDRPWAKFFVENTFRHLAKIDLDKAVNLNTSSVPNSEAILEEQFREDAVKNPFNALKAGKVMIAVSQNPAFVLVFKQAAKNAAKSHPVEFLQIVRLTCYDEPWYEEVLRESAEASVNIDPERVVMSYHLYEKYTDWGPGLLERAFEVYGKKDPKSALFKLYIFDKKSSPWLQKFREEMMDAYAQHDPEDAIFYGDDAVRERAARYLVDHDPVMFFKWGFKCEEAKYAWYPIVARQAAENLYKKDPVLVLSNENYLRFQDMPWAKEIIEKAARNLAVNNPKVLYKFFSGWGAFHLLDEKVRNEISALMYKTIERMEAERARKEEGRRK